MNGSTSLPSGRAPDRPSAPGIDGGVGKLLDEQEEERFEELLDDELDDGNEELMFDEGGLLEESGELDEELLELMIVTRGGCSHVDPDP